MTRPSIRPAFVSTSTTRSGPPPCTVTAIRSGASDAAVIWLPAGSFNSTSTTDPPPGDIRPTSVAPMTATPATIRTPMPITKAFNASTALSPRLTP